MNHNGLGTPFTMYGRRFSSFNDACRHYDMSPTHIADGAARRGIKPEQHLKQLVAPIVAHWRAVNQFTLGRSSY